MRMYSSSFLFVGHTSAAADVFGKKLNATFVESKGMPEVADMLHPAGRVGVALTSHESDRGDSVPVHLLAYMNTACR